MLELENVHYSTYRRILFLMLGASLSFSKIILGMNVSISDAIILLVLLYLLSQHRLFFIKVELLMLYVIIYKLAVSLFIIPNILNVNSISASSIIKLVVVFLYFFISICFEKGEILLVLKGFIYFNVIIGIIGILITFLNLESVFPFLIGSERYIGLMNDPNYYSLIQVLSLAIVSSQSHEFWHSRILIFVLIVSALLSGSKTSLLVLLIFLIFALIKYSIDLIKSRKFLHLITFLLIIVSSSSVMISAQYFFINIINKVASMSFSLSRILTLFAGNALNSGGSDRLTVWLKALSVINKTYGFGIGFADYTEVTNSLYGFGIVAHNTYFQLIAEWGIIFGGIFILLCLIVMLKNLYSKRYLGFTIGLCLAIFYIYFFDLSLNNSKPFWFFLGLAFSLDVRNHNGIRKNLN